MVQSQAVADASSAVVTDQRESWKAELLHYLHQFLRHGSFGISKMVVGRRGNTAAAVGAQIDADHRVIFRQLRRQESPHQASTWEPVDQQNRRTLPVAAHENRVSRNLDLRSFDRILRRGFACSSRLCLFGESIL